MLDETTKELGTYWLEVAKRSIETIRRLCDAIEAINTAYKTQGLHVLFRAIEAAEAVAEEAWKEVGP